MDIIIITIFIAIVYSKVRKAVGKKIGTTPTANDVFKELQETAVKTVSTIAKPYSESETGTYPYLDALKEKARAGFSPETLQTQTTKTKAADSFHKSVVVKTNTPSYTPKQYSTPAYQATVPHTDHIFNPDFSKRHTLLNGKPLHMVEYDRNITLLNGKPMI